MVSLTQFALVFDGVDRAAQSVATVQIDAPARQMHLVAADAEVDLLTDLVAVARQVEVIALGASHRRNPRSRSRTPCRRTRSSHP